MLTYPEFLGHWEKRRNTVPVFYYQGSFLKWILGLRWCSRGQAYGVWCVLDCACLYLFLYWTSAHLSFFSWKGTTVCTASCLQLHKRAERIASVLGDKGHLNAGDNVVLLYPPGKCWIGKLDSKLFWDDTYQERRGWELRATICYHRGLVLCTTTALHAPLLRCDPGCIPKTEQWGGSAENV